MVLPSLARGSGMNESLVGDPCIRLCWITCTYPRDLPPHWLQSSLNSGLKLTAMPTHVLLVPTPTWSKTLEPMSMWMDSQLHWALSRRWPYVPWPLPIVGAPDTMVLWSSIQVNDTVVGDVGPYMDYSQYCSISNNKERFIRVLNGCKI